jgi:23S rRNA (cytosine1962-C5)-methyltransferase
LEPVAGVRHGETDGVVRVTVGGMRFDAHLLEDQKTGLYLDQAVNYGLVAAAASGRRVLDCFSCQGGFAMAAARAGAASVEAVESSEPAIARGRRNAELNELTDRIVFTQGNAFDLLKQYQSEKREYDLVVLDPPSFTRNRQSVPGALRGYKEINLRALKMLGRGGRLATFTCSHHITAEMFREVVVEAAGDARRTLRLVRRLGQASDHPVLPAVPETEYLKGLLLDVV